jgi:hypothetical protein
VRFFYCPCGERGRRDVWLMRGGIRNGGGPWAGVAPSAKRWENATCEEETHSFSFCRPLPGAFGERSTHAMAHIEGVSAPPPPPGKIVMDNAKAQAPRACPLHVSKAKLPLARHSHFSSFISLTPRPSPPSITQRSLNPLWSTSSPFYCWRRALGEWKRGRCWRVANWAPPPPNRRPRSSRPNLFCTPAQRRRPRASPPAFPSPQGQGTGFLYCRMKRKSAF